MAAMAVSQKQSLNPPSKAKRGRPPKDKLKKELSGVDDKMTVNQLVSHKKEKARCQKRKRATHNEYENAKVKSAVMERAMEIKANLSSEFPSLIKYMLPSHVTRGFWLGFPKHFCLKNLPKQDKMIVLEDEEGREFQTKYLVEKMGLSGGWKGFSNAHKLQEGDVCVFHVVEPTKFKVYIVRKKDSDDVDFALGLLEVEASTQQMDFARKPKHKPLENRKVEVNRNFKEKTGEFSGENLLVDCSQNEIHQTSEKEANKSSEELTGRTLKEVLSLDISERNTNQKNDGSLFSSSLRPKAYQSEIGSTNLGSEALDQIRLSETIVDFKEVNSFEDFNIIFNGIVINSELSTYLQRKYYELCLSQKSFLHDKLLEGLNYKLVAGLIAETVNIADAIRAAKLTTSSDNFVTWDQTLKSFQGLGMKVGFLRSRLDQLMNLSLKAKRYQEARLEQVHLKDEKTKLEAKLVEVTEALKKLEVEVASLEEENNNGLETRFQEAANSPW